VSGQTEAEQQTGIPQQTISGWFNSPEFSELRSRTREQVAAQFWAVIQRGLEQVDAGLDGDHPLRDKAQALGILYDRYALLSGQATSRTEHRDLTADLDDHEKQTLRDLIEGALAEPAEAVVGGSTG
jgi:hypothetical protein